MDWLRATQRVFLDYPDEITTAVCERLCSDPRPRPIRRFTPGCAALFAALDTVVGDFFAEHGDVLLDLAARIPGDLRPARHAPPRRVR